MRCNSYGLNVIFSGPTSAQYAEFARKGKIESDFIRVTYAFKTANGRDMTLEEAEALYKSIKSESLKSVGR
jgi:aldehyde:ferredoxin oxidoreductase